MKKVIGSTCYKDVEETVFNHEILGECKLYAYSFNSRGGAKYALEFEPLKQFSELMTITAFDVTSIMLKDDKVLAPYRPQIKVSTLSVYLLEGGVKWKTKEQINEYLEGVEEGVEYLTNCLHQLKMATKQLNCKKSIAVEDAKNTLDNFANKYKTKNQKPKTQLVVIIDNYISDADNRPILEMCEGMEFDNTQSVQDFLVNEGVSYRAISILTMTEFMDEFNNAPHGVVSTDNDFIGYVTVK